MQFTTYMYTEQIVQAVELVMAELMNDLFNCIHL